MNAKGQGLALHQGRLHVWNGPAAQWRPTQQGIARIKLSPDGNTLFALDGNHRLARVQADGMAAEGSDVQLPAGTTDFAANIDGSVLAYRARSEHGTVSIGSVDAKTGVEQMLVPPLEVGEVKSLAIANNGSLFLLNADNELWRSALPLPPRSDGQPPPTLQPLSCKRVPMAADPATGAAPVVDRLQALADGGVGAESADGRLLRLDARAGTWQPAALGGATEVERFYAQFKSGPKGGVNVVGIAFPMPYGEQNTRADKPWYKPSFLHRDRPGESLTARWGNWARAHQPLKMTPAGPGAGDVAALRPQLRADLAAIGPGQRPNELGEVAAQLAPLVNENALKALQKLEVTIRSKRPDGSLNLAFVPPDALSARPSAVVDPQKNVLAGLLQFRTEVMGLGDDDPVNARLQALIERSVFIAAGEGLQAVLSGPQDAALKLPEIVNHQAAVLTGKLLHDHAALARSTIDPSALTSADAGAAATAGAWRSHLRDSGTINQLFKAEFTSLGRAATANHAVSYLSAAMRDDSHKLLRAATAQGALAERTPEAYVRFVEAMRPGQSITLTASTSVGDDTDIGILNSYTTADAEKHKALDLKQPWFNLNTVPNLQPMVNTALVRTYELAIAKTERGITLTIGESNTGSVMAGGKFTIGLGAQGTLGNASAGISGTFFAGAEALPQISAEKAAGQSVRLEFEQDDHGLVQQVVDDLFSGRASMQNLIERASHAGNTHSQQEAYTAALPAHSLVLGIAERNLDADATQQWRALAVPSLEQLALSAQRRFARTTTAGGAGGDAVDLAASHTASLTQRHIALGGPIYQSLLDNRYVTGLDDPTAVADKGNRIQHLLPLHGHVFEKQWWSKHLHADAGVSFDARGAATGVTVNVRAKSAIVPPGAMARAAAMLMPISEHVLSPRNLPQLEPLLQAQPQLRRYVDRLNDAGVMPTVTLELTPQAMAALPAAGASRKRIESAAQQAITDPANLRIKSISVDQAQAYRTSAATGASLLRYRSAASNTFTSNVGRIDVSYPPGEPPQLDVSGSAMLGDDARPAFDRFRQAPVAPVAPIAPFTSVSANPLFEPAAADTGRRMLDAVVEPGVPVTMINDTIPAITSLLTPCKDGEQPWAEAGGVKLAGIAAGRIGLLNGELVARPTAVSGLVVLPPQAIAQHVAAGGRPLLSLMAARCSGQFEPASGMPDATAVLAMIDPNTAHAVLSERPPAVPLSLQASLHIDDIVRDLRSGALADMESLNPAQRYVLQTFAPDADQPGAIDARRLSALGQSSSGG